MSSFELDPDSVRQADGLSSQLTNDIREVVQQGYPLEPGQTPESFSGRRYEQKVKSVPIDDVVSHVSQMAIDFSQMCHLDNRIPCMRLGETDLVPVSIRALFGDQWIETEHSYRLNPHYFDRLYDRVIHIQKILTGRRLEIADFDSVIEGVQRSLSWFLSYRFSGIKKWAEWIHGLGGADEGAGDPGPSGVSSAQPPRPPSVGSGGGLQIQVSCRTPGLRIHVAPAYFVNWTYLGSPTSPVISYVQPGRYIFSGDGAMLPQRTTDDAVFCIPPTYYPSINSF